MHESFYTISDCPVSIALLSDLHNADPTPVLRSLRLHNPAIICVTGDVLYGSRPEGDVSPLVSQANVLPFLRSCASFAPTFLSLGNHEWMLDQEDLITLGETGVTVLDNTFTTLAIDNKKIAIAGLTSGYVTDYIRFREEYGGSVRYPRKESISGIGGAIAAAEHKPETDWLSTFAAVDGFKVMLCHHPEYWPLIREEKIELVLSGHAHGGQWRIFSHGVWAPGQGFWPRWTRGAYEDRLIVSAGLSNTTWIPRIGNPTEIVYVN